MVCLKLSVEQEFVLSDKAMTFDKALKFYRTIKLVSAAQTLDKSDYLLRVKEFEQEYKLFEKQCLEGEVCTRH